MGSYTEIYVNVDLKDDIPDDILDVLKFMCGSGAVPSTSIENIPSRWECLFNSGSYYTPNTSVAKLTYDHIRKGWSLLGKGDIKNYGNEIEEFFERIMPWVDAPEGEFVGYIRNEEADVPTLVHKGGE